MIDLMRVVCRSSHSRCCTVFLFPFFFSLAPTVPADLHNGAISVHSEGEGFGCAFTVEMPMTLPVAGDRSCRHKRSQSHSRRRSDPRSVTADASISASASASATADVGAAVGGVTRATASAGVSVHGSASPAQSLVIDSDSAEKTASADAARKLPPLLPRLALPGTGSSQGTATFGPLDLSTDAHATALARALDGGYPTHDHSYVPPLSFDDNESAPISARRTHPHTPFRTPRIGRSYRLLVVDDSQLNRKVGAWEVQRLYPEGGGRVVYNCVVPLCSTVVLVLYRSFDTLSSSLCIRTTFTLHTIPIPLRPIACRCWCA